MKEFSLFDIIGPDMIGPSSSHTAGAARISYMAQKIFGKPIKTVVFQLHGSFAKTYKGHNTDKALLAGIMGIQYNDCRLRQAFELANDRIEYRFEKVHLNNVHPNTVNIRMSDGEGNDFWVQGSSIGGGNAVITGINEVEVYIDGEYDTLIVEHLDKPGRIAKITEVLAAENINIGFMKVFRQDKGKKAIMVIDTDEQISEQLKKRLNQIEGVDKTTFISKGD